MSRCTTNEVAELESQLSELLRKFTEKHPKVVQLREELALCAAPPSALPWVEPPRNWNEEGGTLLCDGYLTRFADEDFCSAVPREDWTKFEFNGVEYYFQPLSSSADK